MRIKFQWPVRVVRESRELEPGIEGTVVNLRCAIDHAVSRLQPGIAERISRELHNRRAV